MNIATTILHDDQDQHVQWLDQWRIARNAETAADDDSNEEAEHGDEAERLSVLLATVPANTPDQMAAQIEWFKEDLGMYVHGHVQEPQASIFDTLLTGIKSIQAI